MAHGLMLLPGGWRHGVARKDIRVSQDITQCEAGGTLEMWNRSGGGRRSVVDLSTELALEMFV